RHRCRSWRCCPSRKQSARRRSSTGCVKRRAGWAALRTGSCARSPRTAWRRGRPSGWPRNARASKANSSPVDSRPPKRALPRGRWVFDATHRDARSEWALTEWRDGAFAHRVLDRSFVSADGTRWIIDFKLSPHLGGNAEAFLDRERERYRAQLEAYAALLRSLDARPIRLGLYFPLLAGWREWAAAP